MADGDTPGGAAGETPNTRQMPGGEPAEQPPRAYAGAYPPIPPIPHPPIRPLPPTPPAVPLGAAGTGAATARPASAEGQPFPQPPYGWTSSGSLSIGRRPAPRRCVPYPVRRAATGAWVQRAPGPHSRLSRGAAWWSASPARCWSAISLGRAASKANQSPAQRSRPTTFRVDVQDQGLWRGVLINFCATSRAK